MLKKEIEIDGKLVPFRASATVPRLYRAQFKRDIFKDLIKLEKTMKEKELEASKTKQNDQEANTEKENDSEASTMPIEDLELFENVAYIMAKHADPKQPDTPEEWLDQFDTFSIYQVLPEILQLWNTNIHTESESKKKLNQVAGK